MSKRTYKVLGWREWVALPKLGLSAIRVKVDSGARTSALHAEDIRIMHSLKSGKGVVEFSVRLTKKGGKKFRVSAPFMGRRRVRSSTGLETVRPVIRTTLKVGEESWPIEVTLVNRDIMGYRMLLGRSAIQHGFLIDPTESYVLTKKPKVKRKAT